MFADDGHFLNLNVTQMKHCCAGRLSQFSCDTHAHKIRTDFKKTPNYSVNISMHQNSVT